MKDISCPECKKIDPSKAIDCVEKVSAVVSAGISAGVNFRGLNISQTVLSTSLASPSEPLPPTIRYIAVPSKPTMSSIHLKGENMGCIIVIGFIGFVVTGFGLRLTVDHAGGAAYIAAIIVYFALVIILWRPVKKRIFKHAMQKYEQAVKERETAEQEYKKAVAIWNELYYCSRHDGVFLPDGRSLLTPTAAYTKTEPELAGFSYGASKNICTEPRIDER